MDNWADGAKLQQKQKQKQNERMPYIPPHIAISSFINAS